MAHNPKDCCAPWRVLELNIVQPTKSWCMQQRILMRESWPGIVCIKHFLNINFSPGGRLDNTELQSYFNGYRAKEHYMYFSRKLNVFMQFASYKQLQKRNNRCTQLFWKLPIGQVYPSVGLSVGRSVCYIFLKGQKDSLLCSYRRICFIIYQLEVKSIRFCLSAPCGIKKNYVVGFSLQDKC